MASDPTISNLAKGPPSPPHPRQIRISWNKCPAWSPSSNTPPKGSHIELPLQKAAVWAQDKERILSVKPFVPNCLATAIGSFPHGDAEEACRIIGQYLPSIPVWPQLPKRSYKENMYVQYSEGFPGVVITDDERIFVDRAKDLGAELENLYAAYLAEDLERFAFGPDYAEGFSTFLRLGAGQPVAVKGHITGPISWGLTVTDQDRRAVLYDDVLADALAKHLRLKARWQEQTLRRLHPQTIIFVDEPYMSAFGSAFVSLPREKVIALLEEVLQGIEGLKAVHCCGNTDWSLLLATSANILNLDAYEHAAALSLYPAEVHAFLERGGIIAWGIVPVDHDLLALETTESLVKRLEAGIDLLVKKGIDFETLIRQALITPACGLGSLSIDDADKGLELAARVSAEMRRRYVREVAN